MRYITETKNLFDINSAVKVSGVSSFSKNGNQITVSHRAGYSNISANVLLDTSLVGKTVTFSAYAKTSDKNTAYLRIQWLAPNGLASTSLIKSNNVSGQEYQKVSLTGVIPAQPDDEHNKLCLSFYSNGNNVPLPSQVYTVVYTDIQLELGSTATPYVPYGYLPMRRMKYKQNNVCQLLDKSKYPATQTINGVTFTNNGDGTITVNGTASDRAEYFLYGAYQFDLSVIKNHKYLLIITDIDHNFNFVFGGAMSGLGYYEGRAKYIIVTASDTMDGKCYAVIRIEKGKTCNNEIAKPQLFDLTEMYGVGNEPTTVEEFRSDFPEEMYEYTPYCWASMKNIRYLDKTKNLFNAKAIKKTSIKVSIDGSVIILPQVTSPNGYTSTNTTLSELCPNLKVGDTAILNFKTTSAYGHYIWLSPYYERSWPSGEKKIITEEMLNSLVIMYGANIANGETGQVIITNFQIELGDTATPYVPYGYLPLN